MHRGAEKLFEVRDYRQIIVLANRHDWLGAFASELGVVLAAERLAGIEVPPRAVWARTLLAELNRVLSHLAFLSSYPPEIAAGAATRTQPGPRPPRAAFAAREAIQAVMEEISGGRMHYMFNRVGGLKEELPAGWLSRVQAAARRGAGGAAGDRGSGQPGRRFPRRTRGVGRDQRRAGAPVRGERARRPGQRRRFRPAPRRALPGLRRARRTCCGW